MRAVRDRCVWTQQIDHRALVPYLVEESAELIDAIEAGPRAEMREELGDLLWQVLFHAEIASRDAEDPFDIDDVARGLTEKMVRRHPHVFAGAVANTPEEVLVHWNAAKAAEKHERQSVLDGVSHHMPSLALAQKLVGRAAQAGVGVSSRFARGATEGDPDAPVAPVAPRGSGATVPPPVVERGAHVPPPVVERGSGATETKRPESEHDLGDALLALVALARENGWDAERALRERLRGLTADVRAAEGGATDLEQ